MLLDFSAAFDRVNHLILRSHYKMTFDSKMTFEKHLCSVSRAASQRLGSLRKSWRVFHDRSLLGRCFRGFLLPVLEYCSAVWCSAADTHLKLLDRAVSGARFITGGVFECAISHRRSVAVLCTRGGLVAHRYTYAPPRCRTLQYSRTFIPSRCPSGTILQAPFSMVWDWRVSRAGPMLLHWPKLLYPYYSLLLFFPFSSFCL